MKPTRADLILGGSVCLLAALLALALWLFSPRGMTAVIRVDNTEIARLDLTEDTELTVNGTHTVVIRDGRVWVESAPCRDQICAKHPPVSREGETIVCLPYALTVTVESEGAALPTPREEVTP